MRLFILVAACSLPVATVAGSPDPCSLSQLAEAADESCTWPKACHEGGIKGIVEGFGAPLGPPFSSGHCLPSARCNTTIVIMLHLDAFPECKDLLKITCSGDTAMPALSQVAPLLNCLLTIPPKGETPAVKAVRDLLKNLSKCNLRPKLIAAVVLLVYTVLYKVSEVLCTMNTELVLKSVVPLVVKLLVALLVGLSQYLTLLKSSPCSILAVLIRALKPLNKILSELNKKPSKDLITAIARLVQQLVRLLFKHAPPCDGCSEDRIDKVFDLMKLVFIEKIKRLLSHPKP